MCARAQDRRTPAPDDAGGDLGFALAPIVRVNVAFEDCDGLWMNWKNETTHPAHGPDVARLNTA